jgi:mannose-6-phosphate isomerase-like protein (cupin superfamily)
MLPEVTKYKNQYRKDRGWGYELWFQNCQEYCGKLLVIHPGKRGSLHYHLKKKETMLVLAGILTMELIDTQTGVLHKFIIENGDSITIEKGQPHRICNDQDHNLEIIEFSTKHEEEDSLRISKGD